MSKLFSKPGSNPSVMPLEDDREINARRIFVLQKSCPLLSFGRLIKAKYNEKRGHCFIDGYSLTHYSAPKYTTKKR